MDSADDSSEPDVKSVPRLPRAPVQLPPEGPPAMSPRARRAAAQLNVPLQALPIPAPGKRITARDVLAAAQRGKKIPMTTAARKLAADRGVDAAELGRKTGRRLNARDVGKLDPVALRLPAERVKLSAAQIEHAIRATTAMRDVPQIGVDAFIPSTGLAIGGMDLAPALLHAIARVLTDETFKPFRAVLDGDDWVYRGQLNLDYVAHRTGGATADSYLLQNTEKLTPDAIRDVLSAPPVSFDVIHAGVLITVRDLSALPVDGFRAEVEPGQSAVLTVSALQSRMVHEADRGEWVFERGWRIFMGADARVISPELLGFFISSLKSAIENPS